MGICGIQLINVTLLRDEKKLLLELTSPHQEHHIPNPKAAHRVPPKNRIK